jgi:hypothetical protein
MLEHEIKLTYSSWNESVLMFHTFLEVLLLGECHGPSIALPNHPTKDVALVVDVALEPRLVVQVRDSAPAGLVLHLRNPGVVMPLLQREEVLHTNIVRPFIIPRTSNECLVLSDVV